MGQWLLRLMVKILVNLRLTVNPFPLFPPKYLFTINFFYDQLLKFVSFYAYQLNFKAVLRRTVNPI